MSIVYIHGNNVRDGIRNHVLAHYTYNQFTPRLCKYLREFRRYSLDEYRTITIVLPHLQTLEFQTSNTAGTELKLTITSWALGTPPTFQKKRWWKFF
jgi:hypothetical protein